MACNRKSSALPTSCQQLALARQQMMLFLSGQGVTAVETPQLGRVEFSEAKVADLQRLIDQLSAQCAAEQGLSTRGMRRRPISIEACP